MSHKNYLNQLFNVRPEVRPEAKPKTPGCVLLGYDATGAPIYPGQVTISELAQEGATYCVKVFQKLRYTPIAANTAKYVDDCYAEFPKIAAIDTLCRGLGADCDNWAWGQFSYPAKKAAYEENAAVNKMLYPTQPSRYFLGGR